MKKNKWDIIAKEISKIENQYWYDYDYDYDNYDGCGYWCDCWRCSPEFKYLEPNELNWKIITRYGRGLIKVCGPLITGRFIDMDSIYSREILREKKINSILGIDVIPSIPTFGDIFKNKDVDENRDI